jgi:hypothetical protein
MVITVIVPPVIAPALIAPAMIPPVMATPCADDDSRAVVNWRGRRSVVDGRGSVVHGWGYDYRRCHTDADPDVNIGLRRSGEPRQQRRAEKKAQCLEFHMRPHSKLFRVPLRTITRCAEFFIRLPVYAAFLGG